MSADDMETSTSRNVFVRAVNRLSRLGGMVAALAVMLIMVLICLEVVMRNFFGRSTMISDEMSGYLYAAIVFFGLAQTLRDKAFIRVEAIYERVRGRGALILHWIFVLTSIAYVTVLLGDAVRNLVYQYQGNILSDSLTQTPLYIPHSMMVLGWTMLLLQLLTYVVSGARDIP